MMVRLSDLNKDKKEAVYAFDAELSYIELRISLIRKAVRRGCSRERFVVENDLLSLDLADLTERGIEQATKDQLKRLEKMVNGYIEDMKNAGLG